MLVCMRVCGVHAVPFHVLLLIAIRTKDLNSLPHLAHTILFAHTHTHTLALSLSLPQYLHRFDVVAADNVDLDGDSRRHLDHSHALPTSGTQHTS